MVWTIIAVSYLLKRFRFTYRSISSINAYQISRFLLLIGGVIVHHLVLAQSTDSKQTILIRTDSISEDSNLFSISNHQSDIEDQVEYDAKDSTILDLNAQKAYLFGDAQINFQDITLKADYIAIDFRTKDVFATGIVDDSTQNYIGRPSFDDAGKIYEADTMKYNFESKKGM